jgi:hypothetical protein
MEDLELRAFRRGYKDCQIYLTRRGRPSRSPDSRRPTPWWPPEGHEEAYSLGWETARQRRREKGSAQRSAGGGH